MQARKYKRLRDALLDLFAIMAMERGLAPLRMHAVKIRSEEDVRGGVQEIPPGDLIIMHPAHVVVVDVGRQDGVASIIRCWRYIASHQHDLKRPVILFYIAIVRSLRETRRIPSLWEFASERAKRDLGSTFEVYYVECFRPLLNPHEDISPAILDSCQIQLREQGIWEKIETLIGQDRQVQLDLNTPPKRIGCLPGGASWGNA